MESNEERREIIIFGRPYYVTRNAHIYNQRGKEIKGRTEKNGYVRVTLSDGKKRKHIFVHRIVAKAYIENPHNLSQINHIDGVHNNNNVENLEWVTGGENQTHSRYVLGNVTGFYDTPVVCVETNRRFKSTREAWRCYGVSYAHISECVHGKRKSAGGYHWCSAGGE